MTAPTDPKRSSAGGLPLGGLKLKMLAPKTRAALMSVARRVEMPAGAVLFQEGDSGNSLFLIESGRVIGIRVGHDEGGAEWPVQTLAAGEILGETSFMDGGPRHLTALAETDCVILKICPEDLLLLEGGDVFYDNLRAAVGITVVQRLRAGMDVHVATLDQQNELARIQEKIKAKNRELEEQARELQTLSVTDRLTGLFNRLKLDQALVSEIERSQRYNTPLSVVILDIDHFKAVNDTHGHQKGDEVLVGVATIIANSVRGVDLPGRWGGEEFLILCPETDGRGALTLAETIRKAVADHAFPGVGAMTASFGVAQFAGGDDIDSLLDRADRALYRAKRNGRNRVESG